jgi:uncharacterized protein YhaN
MANPLVRLVLEIAFDVGSNYVKKELQASRAARAWEGARSAKDASLKTAYDKVSAQITETTRLFNALQTRWTRERLLQEAHQEFGSTAPSSWSSSTDLERSSLLAMASLSAKADLRCGALDTVEAKFLRAWRLQEQIEPLSWNQLAGHPKSPPTSSPTSSASGGISLWARPSDRIVKSAVESEVDDVHKFGQASHARDLKDKLKKVRDTYVRRRQELDAKLPTLSQSAAEYKSLSEKLKRAKAAIEIGHGGVETQRHVRELEKQIEPYMPNEPQFAKAIAAHAKATAEHAKAIAVLEKQLPVEEHEVDPAPPPSPTLPPYHRHPHTPHPDLTRP